ncbi:hypothetical protein LRS06_08350 [Hymenobacter sp. J193]|uniref:hypothetical protein n=1 Tax=Hymenobacter sp. J193 TaxID=2898429 RepID=UPI002150BF30|nr:hypothetical protein [Hymenobacter sp. J193]MCR5887787.1 hypothetical protein [Hymenobacter sp. J193]
MDSADTSFPPAASAPAWLPAAIRPAVDALLYSSVLVAAAAASLTASTYLFWQRPLPPRLGLFVFAATLFLYNLDSILPYKYAQPTLLSARKRWMLAHRRVLLALALLSLACAGWLFVVELSWHLLAFLGHLAAVSVFYSLPIVHWRQRWHSLREVPLLKGFLIAYVWAAVSVWLPALHLGKLLADPVVLVLFGRCFLFILALTFVFDIRDYTKDHLSGTRTFPGVFGIRAAQGLALLTLLGAALLVPPGLAGAPLGVFTLPLVLAALVVIFARETRSDYYYALLADAVMLGPWLTACWLLG